MLPLTVILSGDNLISVICYKKAKLSKKLILKTKSISVITIR